MFGISFDSDALCTELKVCRILSAEMNSLGWTLLIAVWIAVNSVLVLEIQK